MWRSEDNLQESVLSFYHEGPGNQSNYRARCQGILPALMTIMLVSKKKIYIFQVFESAPVSEVSIPSKGDPGPGRLSHPKVKDWLPALESFFSGLSLEAWASHGVTFISPQGKKLTDHSVLGLSLPNSRLARRQQCCPKPRASGCNQHCAGKYRLSNGRCGASASASFWVSRAHKPTTAIGSKRVAKEGSSIQKQCSQVGGFLGTGILCEIFFQAVQE